MEQGDGGSMQALSQAARWLCPNCGEVSQCALHCDNIQQMKRISIKPILPTCTACGAEIRLYHPPLPRPDTRLLVLTGTCGSGKSTVAEALAARHGFYGIDGNCVMDVIKHKIGGARVAFNSPEVLREIALEIDILLVLGQDIVLSHVIIPDDLPRYREIFRSRGLHYQIIVLQPQCATAVARTRMRDSFKAPIGEEWVKHFHEAMDGFGPEDDVAIVDNTVIGVEETVERILQLYQGDASRGCP